MNLDKNLEVKKLNETDFIPDHFNETILAP